MNNKFLFIVFIILSSCSNDAIINERIISKHLSTLSDDKMEGRRAGTNGIKKAAQYIESEFERIGLSKYETLNSYRQNFDYYRMSYNNIV